MMDPTYDKIEIEANPEWHIAWILSEMRNDNAPIGWSKYRLDAQQIIKAYNVTRKGTSQDQDAL